jgi:hypothetical protein
MANPIRVEVVKQEQAAMTLWLDGLRVPSDRPGLARQQASPPKRLLYIHLEGEQLWR